MKAKRMVASFFVGTFISLFLCSSVSAQIVYVDSSSLAVTPDGSSWGMAFPSLKMAIDSAQHDDTIWVAKGTYFPIEDTIQGDTGRFATIHIRKKVVLLGGFFGNETSASERNWVTNKTILSGNIGDPADSLDNALHVVFIDSSGDGAILDGFTICEGYADGFFPDNVGGGVLVYAENSRRSNPTFKHCIFSKSFAFAGGGVCVIGWTGEASPTFINCLVSGNFGNSGAGITTLAIVGGTVSPKLTNCTVAGNYSPFLGGGMYNISGGTTDTCEPVLNNCIIWNNGSGVLNTGLGTKFRANFSLLQGLKDTFGIGNIDGTVLSNEPQFKYVPPTTEVPHKRGNFQVRQCSPAINAGSADSLPSIYDKDLAFTPRIKESFIDMGCYESSFGVYQNRVYFVDSSALGLNNGLSWTNAYNNLQNALDSTCHGDTLWVARGHYFPTHDTLGNPSPLDPRTKSFTFKKDLVILGGFQGSELDMADRDHTLNPVYLSGNLGLSDSLGDNAYHVFWARKLSSSFLLDGVTIKAGFANGLGFERNGGGGVVIASGSDFSPSFVNVHFIGNYALEKGGGVYMLAKGGSITPLFDHCNFSSNTSGNDGGGMYLVSLSDSCSPIFNSCIISGNESGDDGGGLYFREEGGANCAPDIYNCRISGNKADDKGGASLIEARDGVCAPRFVNCTVASNAADGGGGSLYSFGAIDAQCRTQFINSVSWGNSSELVALGEAQQAVHFSLVEDDDGSAGNQNLDGTDTLNNPDFHFLPEHDQAPDTSGSFSVPGTSSLINKGEKDSLPSWIIHDLSGNARILDGQIDIGAFETLYIEVQIILTKLYVDSSATGLKNGSNWQHAFTDLQDALDIVTKGDTIWIAGGTYFPSKDSTGNDFPSDLRRRTFYLDSLLYILGGFEGNEVSENERVPGQNVTVLSGDIGIPADSSDNAYHVLKIVSDDTMIYLSDLSIVNGNANGLAGSQKQGSAVLINGNLTLQNCNIHSNHTSLTGPVYIFGGGNFLHLFSTSIFDNTTDGSNVFNHGTKTSLQIENSIIEN